MDAQTVWNKTMQDNAKSVYKQNKQVSMVPKNVGAIRPTCLKPSATENKCN